MDETRDPSRMNEANPRGIMDMLAGSGLAAAERAGPPQARQKMARTPTVVRRRAKEKARRRASASQRRHAAR